MKACNSDIGRQCSNEFVAYQGIDNPGHGIVIKCLKANFVRDKLSKGCSIEIGELMREAATGKIK